MHQSADPAVIERLRDRYAQCFACGRENSIGLRLDGFRRHGSDVVADFAPRPEYGGFEDTLHGGIVATALDEILAWSAILAAGTLATTGTLEIRYLRPAPPDVGYELQARVEEVRGRRLRLAGEMIHDGDPVATAKGLYLATKRIAEFGPAES